MPVVHQPVMQPLGTPHVAGRGKQQEWSSGKQWQKNASHTNPHKEGPKNVVEDFYGGHGIV